MKLIECYIENFGRLSAFTYRFDAGMNVLCEENGWGKSTFAAFIKAMLYGFTPTRSRSVTQNERQKYLPWQGGVILVAISVALTMIAGLLPALLASRKDPVVALRSE